MGSYEIRLTKEIVENAKPQPHALTREQVIQKLVDKFLAWPLPDSVCSDLCATKRGYPHRSGTTLLTADEATQMFAHVLTELFQALAQQAQEIEQIRELLGCHRAYITATIQDMLIKAEQQAGEIERLNANQRRQPTENETVCHACDGSGWVDR